MLTMKWFEQLRDTYCGRDLYRSTDEWLSNVDEAIKGMADKLGRTFSPQAGKSFVARLSTESGDDADGRLEVRSCSDLCTLLVNGVEVACVDFYASDEDRPPQIVIDDPGGDDPFCKVVFENGCKNPVLVVNGRHAEQQFDYQRTLGPDDFVYSSANFTPDGEN